MKLRRGEKLSSYSQDGRLGEVLALVQLLAYGKLSTLDESQVADKLVSKPRSAKTWLEIGRRHPEFFRVSASVEDTAADAPVDVQNGSSVAKRASEERIALVARYLLPLVPSADPKKKYRDRLESDVVNKLMDIAVDLHEREEARLQRTQSRNLAILTVIGSLLVAYITTAGRR